MNCKHTRLRRWKIRVGYTEKCRDCGARRHVQVTLVTPSGYREFTPGIQHMDAWGNVRVDLIDVTCHTPSEKHEPGEWV